MELIQRVHGYSQRLGLTRAPMPIHSTWLSPETQRATAFSREGITKLLPPVPFAHGSGTTCLNSSKKLLTRMRRSGGEASPSAPGAVGAFRATISRSPSGWRS